MAKNEFLSKMSISHLTLATGRRDFSPFPTIETEEFTFYFHRFNPHHTLFGLTILLFFENALFTGSLGLFYIYFVTFYM